MDEDFNMPAV
jgi:hypothetical protein